MARASSRRYYTATPVYETGVIIGRHAVNTETGLMEACYVMKHPEGIVLVKVIGENKTVLEACYGGFDHKEVRNAVFDLGHLKRVTRSFVKACLEKVATGEVKTAVVPRKEYKKSLKLKLGL